MYSVCACVHIINCYLLTYPCKSLASLTIAFSESSLWIELMYYINLVQC